MTDQHYWHLVSNVVVAEIWGPSTALLNGEIADNEVLPLADYPSGALGMTRAELLSI